MRILSWMKRHTPVVVSARWINRGVRAFASWTHKMQFFIEWGVDNPEYFDHFLDQYYQWRKSRISYPWERGVFSSLAIKNGSNVLDLCCGDGFNAYHFYSLRAKNVLGIDFDPEPIRWANRNFKASNLKYIVGDIRIDIPDGPFDNVVWDAAVEHFTEPEIESLMVRIKTVLVTDGILSGYTVVEPDGGGKHLHQHEYEFHDKQDLVRFLSPHFINVHVFSTDFPDRTNLYFYATDGNLPFDEDWSLICRQ